MEGCVVFHWAVDVYMGFDKEVEQALNSSRVLLVLVITAIIAPTWLTWWNARVAKRQVTSNGGSSMADKVDIIEQRQCIMEKRQQLHSAQIDLIMDDRGMGKRNEELKHERGIA